MIFTHHAITTRRKKLGDKDNLGDLSQHRPWPVWFHSSPTPRTLSIYQSQQRHTAYSATEGIYSPVEVWEFGSRTPEPRRQHSTQPEPRTIAVTPGIPEMESTTSSTHRVGGRRKVFFFDVDNCLYPKSAKVHDLMAELIDKYFAQHLSLPWDDAVRLHREYYTNYGLAIEGLVRHHQIDPLEYNSKVDDALPLEGIIKPNPGLRALLEDLDRTKVKPWLFTNAYVNHGQRVVRLLQIEDMFDGITYCDYAVQPLVCKPHDDSYARAMREAGVSDTDDCYFVDDNYQNCKRAQEIGWRAAHLVEEGVKLPRTPASKYQIRSLEELRTVFPEVFKEN